MRRPSIVTEPLLLCCSGVKCSTAGVPALLSVLLLSAALPAPGSSNGSSNGSIDHRTMRDTRA